MWQTTIVAAAAVATEWVVRPYSVQLAYKKKAGIKNVTFAFLNYNTWAASCLPTEKQC